MKEVAAANPTWQAGIRALRAKVTPPTVGFDQIEHAGLLENILSVRSAKVVTIVAPAGYGKSSLMCQLYQRVKSAGGAVAWLTLDRSDSDVTRLMSCLEAALEPVFLSMSAAPQNLLSKVAEASPFTLFLDEADMIEGSAAIETLKTIINLLPLEAKIVISARKAPQLALARLRASGHLVEITASELLFSVDRARSFLVDRRGLHLTEADLIQLHRKTEGWIAGLRLAAILMVRYRDSHTFVERFAGAEGPVAEYLSEEILDQQPEMIQDFLLKTSILRELDPSLCQNLVPETHAASILDQLARENIMLTEMAGENPSYRYHPMFADFLRAQLKRELGAEVKHLHLTAARWFEENQRPIPAIDHYLDADNLADAARLMKCHGTDLYLQGRFWLLARWFERIGEAGLADFPELQMLRLWIICFVRGPHAAHAELSRLPPDAENTPVMGPHLRALLPMILLLQERYVEGREMGLKALARLPTGNALADNQLLHAMANAALACGSDEELRTLLSDDGAFGEGSPIAAMYRETLTALCDFFAGHMAKAEARFQIAMQTVATSHNSRNTHAWPTVFCGIAAYERNALGHANLLLQANLHACKDAGLVDHTIMCYRLLARIAVTRGNVVHAFQMLAELELFGRQRGLKRVIAAAALERAHIHHLQGNLSAARTEIGNADDPDISDLTHTFRLVANDIDQPSIARVRLEAVGGDVRRALQSAKQQIEIARKTGRGRRELVLRLISAVALNRMEGEAAALRYLRKTLRRCSDEGFFRLIVDEGPQLGWLVRQLARRNSYGSDEPYQSYVERLVEAFGPIPEAGELEQPLTATELRVLGLLEAGHSNKAMAGLLFVSENTVRAHLRNVNAKIGAHSRLEAVSIARKLGIDF